jgi:hypothetical protein
LQLTSWSLRLTIPASGTEAPTDGSIEGGHGCKYYWVY